MNKTQTKERIILLILSGINFTHILDFMIMMPLGAYLMPYFAISPFQFSLLVSAYTISAAVSGFAAAFFVDLYDRKKILVLAYGLFLLGSIACGLAPNYLALFAARIFAGVFGGLIGAQVVSIVSDTFSYERRGVAMGAIMSAFSLASTIGMPFALQLANVVSWHAPFIMVGVMGLLLLPLIQIYLPSMESHIRKADQHPERKIAVLLHVIRSPEQYKAILFTFLMMLGHFLVIPFINPFMQNNVGFSKEFTPLIYLVGGVSSFFASNILGKMADKYGKMRIFTICVLSALPMIVMLTNMPANQNHVAVLLLFGLWFSVSSGRGVTGSAMVTDVVKPEQRGSFQSFNSSMQQLGTGLASLIAGLVVGKDAVSGNLTNYDVVGYMSIVVLLICLYIARIVPFRNR